MLGVDRARAAGEDDRTVMYVAYREVINCKDIYIPAVLQ